MKHTHTGACGDEIEHDHERGDEPHTHSVHNKEPSFHDHGCGNPRGCQAEVDAAIHVLDLVENSPKAHALFAKSFRLNTHDGLSEVVPKRMQFEIAFGKACLDIANSVEAHAQDLADALDEQIADVSKSDDPHTEEVVERAIRLALTLGLTTPDK